MIPENCRYTETHEWVRITDDCAVIGITDHAQEALGDVTFVELPKPGSIVSRGSECGVIESVKAASDLYSPLTGEISDVNSDLEISPELINSDPMGKGWIFKIRIGASSEIESLMDSCRYDSFLESGQ